MFVGSHSSSNPLNRTSPKLKKFENIFFIDWDDTLFPTTHLHSLAKSSLIHNDDELAELETAVFETLKAASNLGTVFIVTNSQQGWVEASARKYFPKLLTLLNDSDRVQVISARSRYNEKDPTLCKILAFRDLLNGVIKRTSNLKNVVSLGDSPCERKALRLVTKQAGLSKSTLRKSIAFSRRPTIPALTQQLRCVSYNLLALISYDGDIDHQLTPLVNNSPTNSPPVSPPLEPSKSDGCSFPSQPLPPSAVAAAH